jgi:hypothetical protein
MYLENPLGLDGYTKPPFFMIVTGAASEIIQKKIRGWEENQGEEKELSLARHSTARYARKMTRKLLIAERLVLAWKNRAFFGKSRNRRR